MEGDETTPSFDDDFLTGIIGEALAQSSNEGNITPPEWMNDAFPYHVEKFAGRGGSGYVWKAREKSSQRTLALKVVVFQGDTDLARERWLREANVAAALSHPHAMAIHDRGLSPDGISAWLALEWIEGPNLHQLLKNEGPLPWPTLAPWAAQACAAIGALHNLGLIHRDLKPSNLLIETASDRLVVSDFGAVLPLDEDRFTRTSDILLSLGYAAPEQLKAGADIDGRADQYSLAISLWELLTGELPMGAFRPLRSQSTGAPTWLDAVLRKALSPNPTDRFRDLPHFAAALTPRYHRSRRLIKSTLIALLLTIGAYATIHLANRPATITTTPAPLEKNFQSGSVRVKKDLDVFIRFDVTLQPDGRVKLIIGTRSEEIWRGGVTQGAIALLDQDGQAHLVLLSHNFGVTGKISPGNGSSRSDFLEVRIDPAIVAKTTDLHFMAHPAREHPTSPWYLNYPDVPKIEFHSLPEVVQAEEMPGKTPPRGQEIEVIPLRFHELEDSEK